MPCDQMGHANGNYVLELIRMFSIWLPLLLAFSAVLPSQIDYDLTIPASQSLAVQEYDAFLQDWRKGQELTLRHPLFDLTRAAAGVGTMDTISFSGEAHGLPGEISLVFYTMDGDQVYSPPGTVSVARVDEKRREFHVGGVIPRFLRGRTGVVQVTFQGEKRASYLFKVQF